MERISEHVSYKEGVYSATALRRGLENIPNEDQLKCMEDIAKYVFENIKYLIGAILFLKR